MVVELHLYFPSRWYIYCYIQAPDWLPTIFPKYLHSSSATMYASSISSHEGLNMSTKVKKMVHGLQPDIRIALEGENGHNSIMTYSNLDKIGGIVSITCHQATPFEALEITFNGGYNSSVIIGELELTIAQARPRPSSIR